MEDWNQPSTVPDCMLSSLQSFKWSLYTGEPKERDIVVYFLKHAVHLKTATIKSYQWDVPKFEMLKELSLSSRASTACQLVFDWVFDLLNWVCSSVSCICSSSYSYRLFQLLKLIFKTILSICCPLKKTFYVLFGAKLYVFCDTFLGKVIRNIDLYLLSLISVPSLFVIIPRATRFFSSRWSFLYEITFSDWFYLLSTLGLYLDMSYIITLAETLTSHVYTQFISLKQTSIKTRLLPYYILINYTTLCLWL